MRSVEKFLIASGFELETYYHTNKRYRKNIKDVGSLYVRIFSDTNKIIDVEYETVEIHHQFYPSKIVSFETISSLKKLKFLIQAL